MSERPLYGWVVLAAAFVIITMSIGTLFTLAVFLKPIEDSMGWSRSGIGAISFFNWIVMGVGGVVAGYVSDRFGTRRVVLAGAGLLGLGLVLPSHVQEVWQLYLTSGLASIFGRVITGIVADRAGAKPTLLSALSMQAVLSSCTSSPRAPARSTRCHWPSASRTGPRCPSTRS